LLNNRRLSDDTNRSHIFSFITGNLSNLSEDYSLVKDYRYLENLIRFEWGLRDLILFKTQEEYELPIENNCCYPIEVITISLGHNRFVHSILCGGVPLYRFNKTLYYEEDVFRERAKLVHSGYELKKYRQYKRMNNHRKSELLKDLGGNIYCSPYVGKTIDNEKLSYRSTFTSHAVA